MEAEVKVIIFQTAMIPFLLIKQTLWLHLDRLVRKVFFLVSFSYLQGRLSRKSSFSDVMDQFRNATKSLGRDHSRKKTHDMEMSFDPAEGLFVIYS